jgi:hypothetical protein
MTDARLPERWLSDRRLLRLTDAEFRTFITALIWSVSNRTDGRLDRRDLDLIPRVDVAALPGLVAAGLIEKASDDALTIVDFDSTQTSASELATLENVRRNNRKAQARRRDRERVSRVTKDGDSQPDVSLTRESHRIGQDRTGKDRPGHAQEWSEMKPTTTAEVPGLVLCLVCGVRLDPWLVSQGVVAHPGCEDAMAPVERRGGS